MPVLAFVLECAATAAFIGVAVALLCTAALLLLRPLMRRLAPAHRADVHVVLGALPALATLALVAAAALPPVLAALGLARDHCLSHVHHLHLCLVHAAGLRPGLAAAGALALAVFLFRTASLFSHVGALRTRVAALVALGTPREGAAFPVVAVPGPARLCHATGLHRRRILLSAQMEAALSPPALSSALAHEESHLHRKDPLVGLLLAVAGLFAPPPLARLFLDGFRSAAEEACDAEAAKAVGDGAVVAAALVQVAALQHRRLPALGGTVAFGELALERRVQLLLDGPGPSGGPGRALRLTFVLSSAAMLLSLTQSSFLHHAVETLLHHLS
jgi:Zn-dependent protease with chaperone function